MSVVALSLIASLGLVAGVVAMWRGERRRIEDKTRETVMASVMDAQNNFLTNMVYFRTRAEIDGLITPTDLSQMDEAIRDAQHRLVEIAETDLRETRDLGGIKVLARPQRKLAS